MLRVVNLSKKLGDLQVLKEINLEIESGEVVAIIGPSGSGKSTLLRCLNSLEVPDSGTVYFYDTEVNAKKQTEAELNAVRQNIGMVFQHFNLFPHLSVLENVSIAPRLALGQPKEAAEKQALELLERVGLQDKVSAYPEKLSGGQKQRVAIARALAMKPEVMLFDEPTSALDPEMIKEVLMVIADLANSGLTTILVTHEMGFAKEISNRIVFLDEGRIMEDAPPEQFFNHTKNERAKIFLSKIM
ncbi:MAG TPA: amino acid ABC transporter ATP-binding protein [Clostridiaceae bacterium]|nr:amino acid ABC transporter ATP-binding protein [Clostridiaceae bacterium]